ncbi:MAG: diphosphomevalonate decarboxylase [Anaerolineaceae bacterium]|nr:diphosphomevalonate decarboxylase [Anaerolineaceae bacterium]
MSENMATARACANIAFIKYWGNTDDLLRLPVNGSLSMNLNGLYAETTVHWDATLCEDALILNGKPAEDAARQRVATHLNMMRERLGLTGFAAVESQNNFPMGAGIASSAAAFAALTVAAAQAGQLELSERELTTLARLGSGSASRSVPTGFVEWYAGETHEESYAESFAPPEHWNLVDVIAVVSGEHKAVVSARGHQTASTSDLQPARVRGAAERLTVCKNAILNRDFAAFAEVVEYDSNLMHAVMMTSRPPLFYWLPATLTIMQAVRLWRTEGLSVCYTLDAGPNVHCLCLGDDAQAVESRLQGLPGVEKVLVARAGHGAEVITPTS